MSEKRKRPSGLSNVAAAKRKSTIQSWQRNHRRIWVSKEIYDSWQQLKTDGAFANDTGLAAHLISLEFKRRERLGLCRLATQQQRTPKQKKSVQKLGKELKTVTSTSVAKSRKKLRLQSSTVMPAVFSDSESNIDVENISCSVNTGEVTVINESYESDSTLNSASEESPDEDDTNDIIVEF
eukprot:Seg889.7 transcript_id=Seg889.7/GoldUCD/mRNA.D3Y31 product="hypothetical protein" protein_id=Seg889.7/GoldUCD/D3Y31